VIILWNSVEKLIYPQSSTTKISFYPQFTGRDRLFIILYLRSLFTDSTVSTTMTNHVIFPHE